MDWKKFSKPFFVLAPMHEVTDTAFRQVVSFYGKPEIMMTEFVSVDGLTHSYSREKIINYYLKFSKKERPIVAQIWGNDPQKFNQAAKILKKLKFDGIDINMGCPDKKVIKNGGGAALINDFLRAREIIQATKEGAADIPVSIKTRIGFDYIITESWVSNLAEAYPSAITIHGRTKKELSRVSVHWDQIAIASSIMKENNIIPIGNGDICSREDGIKKAEEYGCDGVMIGRAALGNPWIFKNKNKEISIEEKIKAMLKHALLFERELEGIRRFNHFRKHIKGYISDFKDASGLRAKFMKAKNSKELELIATDFLK